MDIAFIFDVFVDPKLEILEILSSETQPSPPTFYILHIEHIEIVRLAFAILRDKVFDVWANSE